MAVRCIDGIQDLLRRLWRNCLEKNLPLYGKHFHGFACVAQFASAIRNTGLRNVVTASSLSRSKIQARRKARDLLRAPLLLLRAVTSSYEHPLVLPQLMQR